jgi:hypothetical protein
MAKRKLKKNVRLKALKATYNPRTRAELLDYDYLKKLKPKDLEWLAQFTNEYTAGAVEKYKAGPKKGQVKPGHIHKTKELAKDCYDRNNWRNNDIYGVTRANNLLYDVQSQIDSGDGWYITKADLTEQALISQIDSVVEEDQSFKMLEYLEARDRFPEDRVVEIDLEVMNKYTLAPEQFYMIVIIYNFSLVNRKKIMSFVESKDKLDKFVQDSEFFKEKKRRTKST